jgi:transmembrane sensor
MESQNEQIVALLHKSVNGEQLDTAEQGILNTWLGHSPHNRAIYNDVMSAPLLEKDIKQLAATDSKDIWNKIRKGLNHRSRPGILHNFFYSHIGRYAAAAAILVLLSAGGWFLFNNNKRGEQPIADNKQPVVQDLQPGGDKAILQLADGSELVLDNSREGSIATQGNMNIANKNGELSYTNSTVSTPSVTGNNMNMISTPKGGGYRLLLADGTKAWLNASSSIKYPVVFGSNERVVSITGEVYFDVSPDARKPFKVNHSNAQIEVLGTRFNINSYEDEAAFKATLLEGSVKINSQATTRFLKPGQQARIENPGTIDVKEIETGQVVAWTENSFYFRDDNIETIMRQLARWYDVSIAYEGKVTQRYTAIISRNKNVSDIFKALEASGGVRFRIEGKKIIVTP